MAGNIPGPGRIRGDKMKRYHREVYTEAKHWERLGALTEAFNNMRWQYTGHCLDHIKTSGRVIDIEGLLRYIKGVKLEAGQIFEYYLDDKGEEIIKVCYRLPYIKDIDLILILGEEKQIITIYINSREDKHYTLKKELYSRK